MTLHRQDTRAAVLAAAAKLAGVALLTLACAGCMFSARQEEPRTTSSVPTDYRLRHPIVVKEAERSFDVLIGARRGALTQQQRREVAAFAREWRQDATGGIIVDLPSGTPNAAAARASLREVRAVLAASGVPARAVEVRAYAPNDAARMATLRLNYPRMAAQAGPCGLWPDDLGPTADQKYAANHPYWNLGCANQRNLAAMVAEPSDLVQPRAEGAAYGPRRSMVFDKYRAGQSPATTFPDADKSAISQVGK